MSTSIRLRVRVGTIEVDYEGTTDLLGGNIIDFVGAILELGQESDTSLDPSANDIVESAENQNVQAPGVAMTVNSIAARVGAKTGTELALAAAYSLRANRKLEKFGRKELLNEMQAASSYYRATFGSNLSKTLSALVRTKRLNETGKDTYALAAAEISRIQALLSS